MKRSIHITFVPIKPPTLRKNKFSKFCLGFYGVMVSTLDSHLFHAENDEDVKWRIKISPKEGLYSSRDSHSWNLGYANFCVNLEASPASQPTIVAKFSVTIYDETTGKKLRYGLGKATKTSEPYAFNLTERRQRNYSMPDTVNTLQCGV